jgi:hypothetical protein
MKNLNVQQEIWKLRRRKNMGMKIAKEWVNRKQQPTSLRKKIFIRKKLMP